MSQQLHPDIESLLYALEGESPEEAQQEPEETLHVYVEDDENESRVTFIRQKPQTIDSTSPPPRDRGSLIAAVIFLCLFLVVCVGSVLSRPTPTSEQFTVTVQGYALAPVHKTVTITAKATGQGYVPAASATGTLVFYNGAIYAQIVPVGTMLKGQDGVEIITDEQATIPPATQTIPPTYGRVSVPAHALTPGTMGNIGAGDINGACCATAIIAQNPFAFSRGKDAEHFTFVTKQDIYRAVSPLLTQLERTVPQLFSSIALSPTCTPTIAAIPPVGQRAEQVRITATVACTAVSYPPTRVLNATRAYSNRIGKGSLTNIAYQVIAIDKERRITFFVTAQWNPIVVRHLWTGK